MLKNINLECVLVLDIETVPMVREYQQLQEPFRALWDEKTKFICNPQNPETPEQLFPRAGIYAEFGKVICISFGFYKKVASTTTHLPKYQFRVKSFYGHDETRILIHFIELLNKHFNEPHHCLCAHNGREFDYPYLARRMLVHGYELPDLLDVGGRKPWELQNLLDTMHLWRFGDYKSYTSLKLLAAVFGIPTPKDDISGGDIYHVYYEDDDLERIRHYCQKDVIATARLLMRYKGLPLLHDEDIIEVEG